MNLYSTKRMLDALIIVTINNGALTSSVVASFTAFCELIKFVNSVLSIATLILVSSGPSSQMSHLFHARSVANHADEYHLRSRILHDREM